MKENKSTFKSIFDTIEESLETPYIFKWSENAYFMTYTDEEYIHEGQLSSIEGDPPKSKSRRYVLTQKALIKYKVILY